MAAELCVIWAVALYVGSLGVGVYAGAITALSHWLVVGVEEPELRRRFGEDYDAYCERVPRWIPRFGAAGPLGSPQGNTRPPVHPNSPPPHHHP